MILSNSKIAQKLIPYFRKYQKPTLIFFSFFILTGGFYLTLKTYQENKREQQMYQNFSFIKSELENLKNEDQYQRNEKLQKEINEINTSYKRAVSLYEELLDLKLKKTDTTKMDKAFAESLSFLADRKYDEAQLVLDNLGKSIAEENEKALQKQIAQIQAAPPAVSNTPPGAGYSRQSVQTETGTFTVSIVAADISSTRVIVDTASGSTCGNECPVLSLSDYIVRNGAFAGVNGSYFCPAEYPSCAGKTNSFDLLLMNKDKVYFNSDNNVYSNNPGVVFGQGYIRFLSQVSGWGRDTGIDSMISNYPLLLSAGNIVFGGDDDPKKGSKGNRSFVADKQGKIFIGVVHTATVAESARVMKALAMDNALNLDNGGSTALWSGGYKVGPGRNLPNAILFVSR